MIQDFIYYHIYLNFLNLYKRFFNITFYSVFNMNEEHKEAC